MGAGRREHTDGTGESMGGVGEAGNEERAPEVSRDPFMCDKDCTSSTQREMKEKGREKENEQHEKRNTISPMKQVTKL